MQQVISRIKNALAPHYPADEIAAMVSAISLDLLQIPQSTYFLKDRVTLSSEQESTLSSALERLQQHEPLQHIIGYADFCGLRFKVNRDVLIPRPETGELVDWIASEADSNARILDIGTGSGCIAITLAKRLPKCCVTAWDISPAALSIAKENAADNSVNVMFAQCDILAPMECCERFDIIVSNPPYIKEVEKSAMEANVLQWEPHTALFVPDDDPLLFYREIARKAITMLNDGGSLHFEINRAHGKEVMDMLNEMGYSNVELRKDIFGNDRMVKGSR